MTTPDFDVIIVGGGPAGLSAGIRFAKKNIRTLILEKKSYPIDKACGEGIMPTGVLLLQELGLFKKIEKSKCYPIYGISYVSPQNNRVKTNFNEGFGLGIRRTELSKELYTCAQKINMLEICENTKVIDVNFHNQYPLVITDKQTISAPLIVGADGLRSLTSRISHLKIKSPSSKRFGINQHFEIRPWSQHVEVYYRPGLEAYITPCSNYETGITFLWDKFQDKINTENQQLFNFFLKQFPKLHERLAHAKWIGPTQSIGPFNHRVSSPIRDGFALIGDAAGYLDPITGEGISLGLLSASLLVHTTAHLFKKKAVDLFTKQLLKPYERFLKKSTRSYCLTTHFALWIAKYPHLTEKIIYDFQKHPDYFAHFLSVNMGTKSLLSKKPFKSIEYALRLIYCGLKGK